MFRKWGRKKEKITTACISISKIMNNKIFLFVSASFTFNTVYYVYDFSLSTLNSKTRTIINRAQPKQKLSTPIYGMSGFF